ncbi:protein BASIC PENTACYSTEINE2-like [Rutidosis leptorrhynchoides]|uniref:protein BASIC PENTACYSTEINE2-like n=1 Tax=Rutidosis leptorrhynchoides TaxID=125765 RepID=UPI003A99090C
MDDEGLRNWGYYEPVMKEHLGLQLMSPMVDHRDTKPFLPQRENLLMMNQSAIPYQHQPRNSVVSEAPNPMQYMRDGWIQRDRFLHMLPRNPNFPGISDTGSSQSMHMIQQLDSYKDPEMNLEDNEAVGGVNGGSSVNGGPMKRSAGGADKLQRAKKPKKASSSPKENGNRSGQRSKTVKSVEVVINGIDMDLAGIPIPVCTCTGAPQQCYRWGCGGWQSACCTTTISMYPLPMSTKRRGARIAGRKMSQGAFKKVLEKLSSEGYDFDVAIDLRSYWAKHGTNKFVTIR